MEICVDLLKIIKYPGVRLAPTFEICRGRSLEVIFSIMRFYNYDDI